MSDEPTVYHFYPNPSRSPNLAIALLLIAVAILWLAMAVCSSVVCADDQDAADSSPSSLVDSVASATSNAVQLRVTADRDHVPPQLAAPEDHGIAQLVEATSKPLTGWVHFTDELAALVTDEDVATWNVVVTSISDNHIVDRVSLNPCVNESAAVTESSPSPTKPTIVRFRLQGSQPLDAGVYELKLEPSVTTSSRWRELLPWERSDSKKNPGSAIVRTKTRMWTLIVMPPLLEKSEPPHLRAESTESSNIDASSAANASPRQTVSERRCLVRWSSLPIPEIELEHSAGTFPISSRFTRIFSASESDGSSPSQRWSAAIAKIDQRLDTIIAVGAHGIVLDVPSNTESHDPCTTKGLLSRYVQHNAERLGLEVWRFTSDEETSENESADNRSPTATEQPNVFTLRRFRSGSGVSDQSETLTVSVFLRPPAETIRGHFPPDLSAGDVADMVWFGRRLAIWAGDTGADEAVRLDQNLTELPLLHRDPAFASNAWLSDWTTWCIKATREPGQPAIKTGLIVDESFFNGEMIPKSASVREAVQLWKLCWSDDSRWLAPAPASDLRSSLSSLVHVRHASLESGTTLICMNRAPWPMRVVFPDTVPANWSTTAPPAIESIRLTPGIATKGGTAVVVPAGAVIVCYSSEPLANSLPFTAAVDEAAFPVARITRQVTTIVESLGLLGELAGMTSHSQVPVQEMVTARSTASESGRFRTVSDAHNATSPTASSSAWGGSLWSSDRWGFGRSVTPRTAVEATPLRASVTGTALEQLSETTPAEKQHPHSQESMVGDRSRTTRAPCRNLVANGGFELPHDLGIPGWMHAHHPSDAVVIDSLVRCEGKASIRMNGKTNAGASSWLISRDLAVPVAGRIGVSLSIRCESLAPDSPTSSAKIDPSMPMEIRVAIEGERDGQPIRHSQTVAIHPDGKWRPGRVALEWLDVDPDRDQNLRLTIDNFAPVTVWIDDVVVTDYFASSAERTELQSLAYLAVQGLQHSDLRPAAKLLANYWANDLLRIASRTSVSMIAPSGEGADSASRSRFPSDTKVFLAPMWNDAGTSDAARVSPPATATDLLLHIPSREGGVHHTPAPTPADPNAADFSAGDQATQTTQPPASISTRIRSWLPSPLRF